MTTLRHLREVAPNKVHPFVPKLFKVAGIGKSNSPGRRSKAYSSQGANIRAVRNGHGLNLVGTVLAAAERGAEIKGQLIDFRPEDLRGSVRRGLESNLIVFVVDASGSMAARDRLQAVTGAVRSLLTDAYQRRDKVAVVSVRGSKPELLLPPTGSIDIAMRRLEDVRTGGRTPLGEGLLMAHDVMLRECRKEPGRRAMLVVLSDGRATGASGLTGVRQAATQISKRGIASVIIDCEQPTRVRLGLAKELAMQLQGQYVRVEEVHADAVRGIIQAI